MNRITINGQIFVLPKDNKALQSVLNHLELVKKGIKHTIKLKDIFDNTFSFGTSILNNSSIEIELNKPLEAYICRTPKDKYIVFNLDLKEYAILNISEDVSNEIAFLNSFGWISYNEATLKDYFNICRNIK
jgi:hypothetical protein